MKGSFDAEAFLGALRADPPLKVAEAVPVEERVPQALLDAQLAAIVARGAELRPAASPRDTIQRLIGRKLLRDEHVHHRNGVHEDNHPLNWEVLSAAQHRHVHRRWERLKAWLREQERDEREDTDIEGIAWGLLAQIDLSEIARG